MTFFSDNQDIVIIKYMRALYKKAAILMKTSTSELNSLTPPAFNKSCSSAISLTNSCCFFHPVYKLYAQFPFQHTAFNDIPSFYIYKVLQKERLSVQKYEHCIRMLPWLWKPHIWDEKKWREKELHYSKPCVLQINWCLSDNVIPGPAFLCRAPLSGGRTQSL